MALVSHCTDFGPKLSVTRLPLMLTCRAADPGGASRAPARVNMASVHTSGLGAPAGLTLTARGVVDGEAPHLARRPLRVLLAPPREHAEELAAETAHAPHSTPSRRHATAGARRQAQAHATMLPPRRDCDHAATMLTTAS